MPSPQFMQLTKGLTQSQQAVLMQLRTGHSPLNEHLHWIGKVERPSCPACRAEKKSTYHFLVQCPNYNYMRKPWRWKIGRRAQEIRFLLANQALIPEILMFIDRMGRLKTTFGEVHIKDIKTYKAVLRQA
jgi:hypothetical protein